MSFIDKMVEEYLDQLMPVDDPLLQQIQQEGLRDEVPIIQVPSLKLLEILLNILNPKEIIELGTAIGFSAIWLAKALPNSVVHTVERKAVMAERARENILKAGLSGRIILHQGEAVSILPTLPKTKFIFIDAAKGKYQEFFDLAFPLLEPGGVIVFDNVLFRGYIADEELAMSKPMLRKIRRFNDFIANNGEIKTSFIPIGDGMAICYKHGGLNDEGI